MYVIPLTGVGGLQSVSFCETVISRTYLLLIFFPQVDILGPQVPAWVVKAEQEAARQYVPERDANVV